MSNNRVKNAIITHSDLIKIDKQVSKLLDDIKTLSDERLANGITLGSSFVVSAGGMLATPIENISQSDLLKASSLVSLNLFRFLRPQMQGISYDELNNRISGLPKKPDNFNSNKKLAENYRDELEKYRDSLKTHVNVSRAVLTLVACYLVFSLFSKVNEKKSMHSLSLLTFIALAFLDIAMKKFVNTLQTRKMDNEFERINNRLDKISSAMMSTSPYISSVSKLIRNNFEDSSIAIKIKGDYELGRKELLALFISSCNKAGIQLQNSNDEDNDNVYVAAIDLEDKRAEIMDNFHESIRVKKEMKASSALGEKQENTNSDYIYASLDDLFSRKPSIKKIKKGPIEIDTDHSQLKSPIATQVITKKITWKSGVKFDSSIQSGAVWAIYDYEAKDKNKEIKYYVTCDFNVNADEYAEIKKFLDGNPSVVGKHQQGIVKFKKDEIKTYKNMPNLFGKVKLLGHASDGKGDQRYLVFLEKNENGDVLLHIQQKQSHKSLTKIKK